MKFVELIKPGLGVAAFGMLVLSAGMILGCSPSQDTDKTRKEAADAAAQIKEGSKVAAVEIKKGAVEAGRQGKAIAEGVKEGWTSESKKVNVNRASKTQLLTLPGMDDDSAQRVIAGRPYHTKDELNTKGIVSPEEFQKIQGQISVNSN
jgi:DNA uptake protein ComE-like DNA-binding protein